MLAAGLLFALIFVVTSLAMLWRARAARRSASSTPDVIYLGYDDQDNVSSMRAAMLDRLRRGELDGD